MKFEHESWRKLYVLESIEHRRLSLFTRGLRDYLLRQAEADGTLLTGAKNPAEDLAGVLNAKPAERKLMAGAIDDLIRIGYLKHERGRLWIVRFSEAQEARSPGAKRQAAYKARKQTKTDDGGGDDDTASPGDVSETRIKASPGDVTNDVTNDETRNDETTATKPLVVAVACPGDLKLAEQQRGTLETALIPGWAIDASTLRFVAKYGADPEDRRTLVTWRKCLSMAISGDWNDANKRPKKPEAGANASVYTLDADGRLVS